MTQPASAPKCAPCKVKTVTARVVSVTFHKDQLQGGKKLLKRAAKTPISIRLKKQVYLKKTLQTVQAAVQTDSFWAGGNAQEFKKPEWSLARGGPADSHPASYDKSTHVEVDVEFDLTVNPKGETANVTKIMGTAPHPALKFSHVFKVPRKLKTGRYRAKAVVAKNALPDYVELIDRETINWSLVADGQVKPMGWSGPHTIYVTLKQPGGKAPGKMISPRDNHFQEGGADQVVTEHRLRLAVTSAQGTGRKDEKECVDAVFRALSYYQGVGYELGRRWVSGPNTTFVYPKPSLHHYLWLCAARKFGVENHGTGDAFYDYRLTQPLPTATDDNGGPIFTEQDVHVGGECHNIAATFFLLCRILGVQGDFEIGYMFPWPSRSDAHPDYPKTGDKLRGKYNKRKTREHSALGHGGENLVFIDGHGMGNNFEGVANYKNGKALYGIGDAIFDQYGTADENASTYFSARAYQPAPDGQPAGPIVILEPPPGGRYGLFDLAFSSAGTPGRCKHPYGKKTGAVFRWDD